MRRKCCIGANILSLMLIWPMGTLSAQNVSLMDPTKSCPDAQHFRDDIGAIQRSAEASPYRFWWQYDFYQFLLNSAQLPKFLQLKNCADQLIDIVVSFLGDTSSAPEPRWIAGQILYPLDRDQTLVFITKLVTSGAYRNLSADELVDILSARKFNAYNVVDDFDNSQTHALLLAFQYKPDLDPATKVLLEAIASGETWFEHRDLAIANIGQRQPFNRQNAEKVGTPQWRPRVITDFSLFARLFRSGKGVDPVDANLWIRQILNEQKSFYFANMQFVLRAEYTKKLENAGNSESIKKVQSEYDEMGKSTAYQHLITFFDSGLASTADGDEWLRLWQVWNPDFSLPQGMDMKVFVALVRDELKKQ